MQIMARDIKKTGLNGRLNFAVIKNECNLIDISYILAFYYIYDCIWLRIFLFSCFHISFTRKTHKIDHYYVKLHPYFSFLCSSDIAAKGGNTDIELVWVFTWFGTENG